MKHKYIEPSSAQYNEGRQAYRDGQDITSCPYKPWTFGGAEWMRGFKQIKEEHRISNDLL